MSRPRVAAGLVVALGVVAVAGACTSAPPAPHKAREDNIATAAQVRATADAFGIKEIEPTRPGGTIWTSNWNGSRDFVGVDPKDPWFDADHGSASYKVRDGELLISGDIPRMYIHDPADQRQWRDVEVTMYFKRVADSGIPYAGMTMVARSNHLDTESGRHECDTRGYGGRMRYDGHTDFEKETAFPLNEAVMNKVFWPDGLPTGRWIGLKLIVKDVPPAPAAKSALPGVDLQLWTDLTDGRGGGTWQKINEVTDNGNLFGKRACAPGIDPRMQLTASPDRPGSESGKPNLTVYFRSDGVATDGLAYKWGSVREIAPTPPAD